LVHPVPGCRAGAPDPRRGFSRVRSSPHARSTWIKLSALKSGDFPLAPEENSILDVRLAHRDEAALYKQAAAGSQSTDDLLLVYLVELDGEGQ
jgi:hypothetical protein